MTKEKEKNLTGFEIAVIGMDGRFPGAADIDEFWENLKNGVDSITFFSEQELVKDGEHPDLVKNPNYVKASGMLDDIDYFDSSFFNYTPVEALLMDPQVRILHECAWKALEDAGYCGETYTGLIGFYAGAPSNFNWSVRAALSEEWNNVGTFAGEQLANKDLLFAWLSYKLNLKGSSFSFYTACSTSLVAIHIACQALLNGECDMALTGGATVTFLKKSGYLYQEGMLLSPDGHLRAFDAGPHGTVGGNGAGLVVLKRLEDAAADRDHIYAVIKGSAVNNDGMQKIGFTAPSVEGQARVIKTALLMAEVQPESITYIETHGTGTSLGDLIEIKALNMVFETRKKGFCALGSVKTNIGHLDAAAGVSGFIKTVLTLKYGLIPPSLYFEIPNPEIDFINSPFYINNKLTPWKNNGCPVRAGVSSFGVGGTNAHVILEAWPQDSKPVDQNDGAAQLILLSARTEPGLERAIQQLVNHLEKYPDIHLPDMAYTLQLGRKAFKNRDMTVCSTTTELVEALSTPGRPANQTTFVKEENPKVAFIFPGQGNLYADIGKGLYLQEPLFAREVDRCADILEPLMGCNIKEILYPAGTQEEAGKKINDATYANPIKFVIEYSLAKLLMEWGIEPYAMIGHSAGEYVAAHLSGVFSLESALTLIVRGATPEAAPPRNTLKKRTGQATWSKPGIPYISGSTGKWITAEEALDTGYWARTLTHGTRFSEGLKELLSDPNIKIYIQFSSDSQLSLLVNQHRQNPDECVTVSLLNSSTEKVSDMYTLLSQLGRLWLSGVSIDWSAFYNNKQRNRIPLPTYSFERDSYWLEREPFKIAAQDLSSSLLLKNSNISDWFYIPSWKRSITPLIDVNRQMKDNALCWLVFAHSSRLCSLLIERLEGAAHDIIVVKIGPEFKQVNDTEFTISPRDWTHYDSLFNTLVKLKKIPNKILHFWEMQENKTHVAASEEKINETVKELDLGFFSLINIARACEKQGITSSIGMFILGRGLQGVTGEETVSAAKAAALGLVRVIPQEIPNIKCIAIDLSNTPIKGARAGKLVQRLLAEFYAKSTDLFISYRKSQRWVQAFTPVKLDGNLQCPTLLREEGVYVITGGLGNVAIVLADHLARTVKARLVLIGRSPFPPREEWEDRLKGEKGQDLVSLKIQRLREMEAAGARVLVLQADVSNRQQMHQAIFQAEKEFGKINGVIHAAGFIGNKTYKLINSITRQECEEQFQSKIYGLLVLEEVLAHKDLDFCQLVSSMSSILGGLGFAAYSAANIFMDAFVHQYNKTSSVPWISVNWDGWHFEKTRDKSRKLKPDDLAMTEEEASTAFQCILDSGGVEQVVVSLANLDARIAKWVKLESLHDNPTKEDQDSRVGKYYPRPHLSVPYEAPNGEFEQKMVEAWQQFFRIEPVGTNDSFFELGGDSLKAVQLASQIKNSGIDITIQHLFTYNSIREICKDLLLKNSSEEMDMKTIEDYLSEQYNTEVYYREYQVDEESYRILFLAHEALQPREVLEQIKKKANPGCMLYPHYIIIIDPDAAIPAPGAMDEKVLAKFAGLKDRITETEEARLLEKLDLNNQLSALLKKNTPIRQYEVAPTQKNYFFTSRKHIETNFVYYYYNFSYPLDYEQIIQILSAVADKHSLLRSVIVEEKEMEFFIKEYDSFSNLQLPFLDLSSYSPTYREVLIRKAAYHFKTPLDVLDNVLYRAALVKLDHSHYRFIAQFNHLIFDASSVANIDRDFKELSHGGEPGEQTVPNVDFSDYVEFMKKQNYDHIELEKYLNLHDYSSAIEEVEKNFPVNPSLEYENFELDISIINETYKVHYNQIVLMVFASVIGQLLGVDKVPIRYYSHGRIYKDGDFSHIIGDFPDDIPLLLNLEDFKDPPQMMDHIIQYRQFISMRNLNFINYAFKGYLDGGNYGKLTSPFVFDSVVGSYEYFKKTGSDELIYRVKIEKLARPHFFLALIEDFHANKLLLLLLHNSGFKIKEVFMEKFVELVKVLNKKET